MSCPADVPLRAFSKNVGEKCATVALLPTHRPTSLWQPFCMPSCQAKLEKANAAKAQAVLGANAVFQPELAFGPGQGLLPPYQVPLPSRVALLGA